MRSSSPAAFPATPSPSAAGDRREPSFARAAAPRVVRSGPQPAGAAEPALPELRAGERVAVLSGTAPVPGEAKSMLVKAGFALGGVLALVGAATLLRLATGL